MFWWEKTNLLLKIVHWKWAVFHTSTYEKLHKTYRAVYKININFPFIDIPIIVGTCQWTVTVKQRAVTMRSIQQDIMKVNSPSGRVFLFRCRKSTFLNRNWERSGRGLRVMIGIIIRENVMSVFIEDSIVRIAMHVGKGQGKIGFRKQNNCCTEKKMIQCRGKYWKWYILFQLSNSTITV